VAISTGPPSVILNEVKNLAFDIARSLFDIGRSLFDIGHSFPPPPSVIPLLTSPPKITGQTLGPTYAAV